MVPRKSLFLVLLSPMILFYAKNLSGSQALLEEDEYQHCIKVLRHKSGDTIELTDGAGTRAQGTITDIKKREALISLGQKTHTEASAGQIHLYVAPPKNRTRWEWLLEKSVELGVDTITALSTARTERSRINEDRTHKIIRSAAMQSLRPYHPRYKGQITLPKLTSEATQSDKYIAHYAPAHPQLYDLRPSHQQVQILVGPEGDFSPEELQLCQNVGYLPVNISDYRLRTETAAITTITILKTIRF